MSDAGPNDSPDAAPGASGMVPRERLFARLDDALSVGAVRVSGSAGIGKSALVSSYLAVRELGHLHIRLDAGDADPFRLIARLDALAGPGADDRPGEASVPDPLVAGRRAFARLAESHATPRVIVLDDHERLPEACPAQRIVADAVDTLPDGWSMLLIGRGEPPPAFARLRASRALTTLDETELLLTPGEIAAVATSHASRALSASELDAVARLSGGWAAIVVLLAIAPRMPDSATRGADIPEVVFDYFAEEVFDALGPALRHDLERLSPAPLVTSELARAVATDAGALERLDALARRHFFVERIERPGSGLPHYRLHALFRAFLARRLERGHGPGATRAAGLGAADALEAGGEHEAAIGLRLEHRDVDGAARAIERLAPRLLVEQRWYTVLGWFAALPSEQVAASGPLSLWHGAASAMIDPPGARERLDTAWRILRDVDPPTAMLACCLAIETWVMHWDDFHGMDLWIERLDAHLVHTPLPDKPVLRSHVVCAMANADIFRRLEADRVSVWQRRGLALLDTPIEPQVLMMLAQALVITPMWNDGMTRASVVLDRVRARVFVNGRIDPLHELWYRTIEAVVCWNLADRAGAEAACERGLACARETGAGFLDVLLHYHAGMGCVIDGDVEAASVHAESIAAAAASGQLMNVVSHHQLAGTIARLRGDTELAVAHLEQASERAASAGLAFAEALMQAGLAFVERERGDTAAADGRLERARVIADRLGLSLVALDIRLFEAWRADRDGARDEALDALRDAFGIARRDGRVASVWWSRPMLARLCALALEANIETAHVERVVRLHRLEPPPGHRHLERWPRRVAVRLLGVGEIVVDGERIVLGGQRGSRPLELVQALAALGGRANAADLADLLWPDAEGGAAMDAFKTTLARARRQLGVAGALVLADGRLTLDAAVCWCDVVALTELDRHGAGAAGTDAGRRVDDTIIALYRSDLLPDERVGWAAEPRRRLRERWLRAVLRRGDALSTAGDHAAAARLHEEAIETSPDVEVLYRQAMIAHLHAGGREAGLLVHARCERQRALHGQSAPDAATEAIRAELARLGPAA